MEQISGKSLALRESVTELYIGQKVDHENRPQISAPLTGAHVTEGQTPCEHSRIVE